MNVNEKIISLESVLECEVVPDEYDGTSEKFITFTYEDERPALQGNNRPTADIAYLMVQYHTPKRYDYMEDKEKIKLYLESQGFKVTAIQSWINPSAVGTEKTRTTTFSVNYTEQR